MVCANFRWQRSAIKTVYPKFGNAKKRKSSYEDFRFHLRYLAESNCSTRFCRPLPNRSAKVPNCFFAMARLFEVPSRVELLYTVLQTVT